MALPDSPTRPSRPNSVDDLDPNTMELLSQDRRAGPRLSDQEARISDRVAFTKVVWCRMGRPTWLEVRVDQDRKVLALIPGPRSRKTRRVEQHKQQCRVYLGRTVSLQLTPGLYRAELTTLDSVTALVVHMYPRPTPPPPIQGNPT